MTKKLSNSENPYPGEKNRVSYPNVVSVPPTIKSVDKSKVCSHHKLEHVKYLISPYIYHILDPQTPPAGNTYV